MPESSLLDPRVARALSHPLRRSVLGLLMEQEEASPNQIAGRLGAPLSTVSYHVHILRDLGCIELVHTEPRRGAVEHFYKATIEPYLDDAQWESLPAVVRRQLAGQTLGELVQAMGTAVRNGGFDVPQAHVDRVPLRLDEQGWVELSELLTSTLRGAADIQRRSNERAGADVRASQLGIVHFAE
jgi:DNA-binding transcriptional ArsR family regulator